MELNFNITGQLFPNPITIIVQLCATAVLFYFVKKYLWGPAQAYLAKRSDLMHSQLENAKQLEQEGIALKEEALQEIKQAGKEAKTIIERGKEEGIRTRDGLIAEGKKEAELKLDNARRELEFEKSQMRKDVHKEIVDVALMAAEKLLEEKVDDTTDRKAIERFVKEVEQQ